jgi:hypothetical protein
LCLSIAGLLFLIGLLAWPRSADAHDAPSGWTYPWSCCSNMDCQQISKPGDAGVKETSDGYVVKSTGEVIAYGDKRVKASPDGEYHWCAHPTGLDRTPLPVRAAGWLLMIAMLVFACLAGHQDQCRVIPVAAGFVSDEACKASAPLALGWLQLHPSSSCARARGRSAHKLAGIPPAQIWRMTESEVLGLIVTLVTLVGGVLAVWWRIEGRIKAAENVATLKAESAFAAAQMLAEKLAEHRLHSAETFVTKAGLRETTEQIMTAIGDIKSSVNGLSSRLDRIIEDRRA